VNEMGSILKQPVTMVLIAICLMVAALSNLGENRVALLPLFIVDLTQAEAGLTGELWRWVTPAFIHFGVIHLLFNMMWLWDLGRAIEFRKGSAFYLGFVLALAVAANLVQYFITREPLFGGMSGVVYGFLGYVWIMGRRSPRFGMVLPQQTVIFMGIWFVLCWTGLLGPIANWAHAAGLALGVAWAFVESSKR
jgi:GlpG protein